MRGYVYENQSLPDYCKYRRFWIFLALGLMLTVPFLHKPFHIDDSDYLRIARHIRQEPLDPYDFELARGGRWFHVGAVHPSPPLFCYALAAVGSIFGERELPLHLLSSLFVIWGVWLTLRLAERLRMAPLPAVFLIMASPMLLPGQNVMLDVPMLVLVLAAVERQLAAMQSRPHPWAMQALSSGLLLSAAFLTKYPAAVVAPGMLLLWWIRWRRIPWTWLLGLLPCAAWMLLIWLRYHPAVSLTRAVHLPTASQLAENAVSVLIILGATCLASPLAVRLPGREPSGWPLVLAAAAGATIAVGQRMLLENLAFSATPLELVLRGLFGAAGALLISTVASSVRELVHDLRVRKHLRSNAHVAASRSSANHSGPPITGYETFSLTEPLDRWADRLFLVGWFLSAAAFNLVVRHTTVRHALVMLPPLVFLILQRWPQRGWGDCRCRLACAFSVVLAFGLAAADAHFAASVRTLMQQLADRYSATHVVYVTGEWEMSYYAERAGLVPLHERIDVTQLGRQSRAGEASALLAVPLFTYQVDAARYAPYVKGPAGFLEPPAGWNPLRTIAAGVNYYDVGTRNLPWSLSRQPWEAITLYRIEYKR